MKKDNYIIVYCKNDEKKYINRAQISELRVYKKEETYKCDLVVSGTIVITLFETKDKSLLDEYLETIFVEGDLINQLESFKL